MLVCTPSRVAGHDALHANLKVRDSRHCLVKGKEGRMQVHLSGSVVDES